MSSDLPDRTAHDRTTDLPTPPKGRSMKTTFVARRVIASALALAFVVVGAATAAPAAAGAEIGSLSLDLASGNALSVPIFDTSGQCPAGDTVRVKMFGGSGAGATIDAPLTINSPKNIVGTNDAASLLNGAGGMTIPSPATFADFATNGDPVLTVLNGVYTVRAWCSSGGWFEGKVTFTGTDVAGATWVRGDATPTGTAPSAVATAVARAGDATAVVSWTPPASDGGSPLTGYVVSSYPGSKMCTTTTALTCTVTGLIDGYKYYFRVYAVNKIGISPVRLTGTVIPTGVIKKLASKVITIGGTARVGYTVKAVIPYRTFYSSSGSIWSGIKYTYQWKRGSLAIRGATKYAYRLTAADRGKRVTVVVTAWKTGFRKLSAVSRYVVVR